MNIARNNLRDSLPERQTRKERKGKNPACWVAVAAAAAAAVVVAVAAAVECCERVLSGKRM